MERLRSFIVAAVAWLQSRVLAWFKAAPARRLMGTAVVIWAAVKAWQVIPAGLVALEKATVVLAIGLAETLSLLAPFVAPFLAMAVLGIIAWAGVYLAR